MTELALNRTLVALTPQDVPAAQTEIAEWCRKKILDLGAELADARRNLRAAKKLMLGSPKTWQNLARKTAQRMIYYSKIQAAVKAGYLVVPNLPAELIAVRVNRAAPSPVTMDAWPSQINAAKAEMNLPVGTGRYVDETNPHLDLSYDSKERNPQTGEVKTVHHRLTQIAHYDEGVDFPVALVRPEILAATERAMALKIFDEIGVVHGQGTMSKKQRKSDPIVIGRILDGGAGRGYGGAAKHYVTFFIAWWLDTQAL